MRISRNLNPFPHIVIDDYLPAGDLPGVWEELEHLRSQGLLQGPELTQSAHTPDGTLLKNNSALFLYDHYDSTGQPRHRSKILTCSRHLFSVHVKTQLVGWGSWFFDSGFYSTNYDSVLVSYYEDGDYYSAHRDTSLYTALIWLYREPRAFTGGNLRFPEFGLEVEIKPNRCLIFPGQISHEVAPVVMSSEAPEGSGRYTITQFADLR